MSEITERAALDAEALRQIAVRLNRFGWDAKTCAAIADIARTAGHPVRDSAEDGTEGKAHDHRA
jgi:hypothetical protein